MTAVPAVPGALNITELSGSEIVSIATSGPMSAQTTTQAIADLVISPGGNTWFVNETTGADTNNGSAKYPFKTLDAALAAATASNGDVVLLQGTSHRTTTLNWNKNGVSLVGINSPSNNDRARISVQSVAGGLTQTLFTALHPLVNVTAQGCSFVNIGAFYGGDGALTPPTSSVCWAEAGGRNLYSGCQFFGFGDALMAVLAGARALTLAANGENLFAGCTFGADTLVRSTAANATVEFIAGGASPRNIFRSCVFEMQSSLNTNNHILVSAGGLDRYALFQGCFFHNFNATALSAAIVNNGGSPSGNVIVQYRILDSIQHLIKSTHLPISD